MQFYILFKQRLDIGIERLPIRVLEVVSWVVRKPLPFSEPSCRKREVIQNLLLTTLMRIALNDRERLRILVILHDEPDQGVNVSYSMRYVCVFCIYADQFKVSLSLL